MNSIQETKMNQSINFKEKSLETHIKLKNIANGNYSPENAWEIIRKDLKENNTENAIMIVDALFHLALNENISKDNIEDARNWYNITWKVSAIIENDLPKQAGRLQAISDILRAKVSFAENTISLEEEMKRKYVSQILEIIYNNNGNIKRKDIAEKLKVKISNIYRVLQRMQDTDLITKEKYGSETILKITEIGNIVFKSEVFEKV